MNSKLKAIGRQLRLGVYVVRFYYELPNGGIDIEQPTTQLPARDFDHMQSVVRAFNGE